MNHTCVGDRSTAKRGAARLPEFCLILLTAGWFTLIVCSEAGAQKRPVYVTASFVDKNGLFIENLERSEIEILEDGKLRKIEFMARDELPAVYGLVFDRGMLPESDEDERTAVRAASSATTARSIAYELIDKYLGRNALWVADYERELQVAADLGADGFEAKNAIHRLRGRRRPEDSFLYAALFSSVQKMNERQEKRRVLILFVQDMDAETAGKLKPLKNLLSASNVELFIVALTSRLSNRPGTLQPPMTMGSLKELAQVTSGQVFFGADYRDHYEDLVRRIHSQIRTFYTFGFEAESKPENPGKLVIKCSRPGSRATHHPLVPAFR